MGEYRYGEEKAWVRLDDLNAKQAKEQRNYDDCLRRVLLEESVTDFKDRAEQMRYRLCRMRYYGY